MMKKILCLVLPALLLLCSCTSEIPDEPPGTSDESLESSVSDIPGVDFSIANGAAPSVLISEGDSAPSEYPVVINGTQINSSPKRIVCLSQPLTEMIYEFGFGDRLIARGSYCDYPEEAAALPDAGRPTQPDIDAIISMQPDLLLTATAIAGKDKLVLSDSGIEVLYIPAPLSFGEFENIYTALGMVFYGLFDGESRGAEVFSDIKTAFSESDTQLGSFIYVTEGLCAAGGDTFESSVLSFFGKNLAEDRSGYIPADDIADSVSPDTVILNSVYGLTELADSGFGMLDAVKNGRVIIIDNSYFEAPSKRITELIGELR